MLTIEMKSDLQPMNAKIKKRVEEYVKLNKMYARVGIPDNAMNRGTRIVDYAKANEYGVVSKNIPARPFLHNSLKPKYSNKLFTAVQSFGILSKFGDAKRLLKALGRQGADNVRESIDTEVYEPLSPLTIAKKGNDTILRDTEAMYKSITSEIRRN